ncbi:acetoin utilization protein AcuC [Intrasporangium oryzae NRRL B-24470]|uniref:Acetoin utilization protein AcuC n=1 Tax=Intrasporangium oryzae NRRL B-24470 TaxID=1386089 RepID=W9GI49_9MICO|nr:acetoin utilization protein AcuC [Intrasporangium oryzae]EWT03534.1 acetoin utilization protein AcuC [Intrasporangium oryzae NRRL B-24470]
MPTQARVVWDDSFTHYDFGPTHPMAPVRLDLTARLCDALGVFDADGVERVGADIADDALLETVHDADYIAAVRAASVDPETADPAYGLGTEDDPAFVGMHDASARVVRGTVDICRGVWEGETRHGVNFTGGLHHAMPGKASGFCVYNDIAVGIRWLLANGAKRVAYVDLDVHHGDGVERIFWDDPRVLTISVHETGRALFPGTGWPTDIGGPGAEGYAVNVSLPPGLSDAGWLRAIHATVPALVRSFKPDVLVTQHGCDTHAEDPLAHFAITVDAQRSAAEAMHRLAHDVCDGRWVALGGGGYEVVDVVPRTWTHLTAIAAHVPIKTSAEIPEDWREHVQRLFGRPGPRRMGDLTAEDGPLWWRSWEMGYDPGSEVDRAIMATRTAVFPHHGLDIHFD